MIENSKYQKIVPSRGNWKTFCAMGFLLFCFASANGGGTEEGERVSEYKREVIAQDTTSIIERELEEFEVRAPGRSASGRKVDKSQISADRLQVAARVLGEADVMVALRQESGVQTAGDYGSGLSFEGADPYHSVYRVDGAPVFFPYRFGGIFSTFNTSQYDKITLWRAGYPPTAPMRLGTAIDLESHDSTGEETYLMANLGIISSSASIRQKIGEKVGFTLSGRISYMNLLYHKFLQADSYGLRYDFADVNMSLFWHTDRQSRFLVSFFYNSDELKMDESTFDLDMKLRWHNETASIKYEREGDTTDIDATAYASGFGSRLGVSIPGMDMSMPASISSVGGNVAVGIKGNLNWLSGGKLFAGGEFYKVKPQWPEGTGMGFVVSGARPVDDVYEIRGGGEVYFLIPGGVRAEVGLTFNYYIGKDGYDRFSFLPRVTFKRKIGIGEMTLGGRVSAQPLHQVGFSEIGMASNYWMAASGELPVERGWKAVAGWEMPLPWWGLQLVTDAYFSEVSNQPVYTSGVLSVLDPGYAPSDRLRLSEGWNAGVSAELRKEFGNVNGKLGVSYSISRRHFGDSHEWWYGNYDGGLKMSASVNWIPGRHWVLGATFNYASGRVYTPVRGIYLLSANIASEFGKRNSARLPSYQRLDLSATYILPIRNSRCRHLINISLLNAYGHKNIEMQYYRINPKDSRFGLKQIFSLYRFMPSISYTFELK